MPVRIFDFGIKLDAGTDHTPKIWVDLDSEKGWIGWIGFG